METLQPGTDHIVWQDVHTVPATDSFCLPCKMTTICSANRGTGTVALTTQHGQIFSLFILYIFPASFVSLLRLISPST